MRPSVRRLPRRSSRLLFNAQRPLRRLLSGLLVGILVGGLMAAGLQLNLFSGIRARLKDALYNPRPTRGVVSLIAIDDASLSAYGRSVVEWPRTLHADLIRLLHDAGARVIAFDILFVDPSQDPAEDADLAAAMREARNVILPVAGAQPVAGRTRGLFTYGYFDHPVPELEAAARGLGHIMVGPDDDNFVRRYMLYASDVTAPVPSLALATYLEYLRYPAEAVELHPDSVKFAGRTLYTDSHAQMLITYFGPPSHPNRPSTFPVYSLVDVLEGRVPPEVFKDQIVLIGVLDAAGLPDNYPTPMLRSVGQETYGVEIHANVIETIHQSLPSFQARVNWKLHLGPLSLPIYRGTTGFPLRDQPLREQLLLTFLLALDAGALLPFLRWYIGLPLVLLAYAAYFLWASAAFTIAGRIFELLFPLAALLTTFMGTLIVIYVFEERRRGQINDLFSRYVSPEIAQKIVEAFDHGRLELGGEEREITVLFADVRGFTPLSEGLPPAEVVSLLNVFLEEMSAIVMAYGGAINKYIGDNLMAFWNAPYSQDDHAWQATRAALDMLAAVQHLNETRQFKTPVQFGIGINTGPAVVGNIGSEKRLEYTPIGDTVNVASRLCGVAPGGSCFIGAPTYRQIADRVRPVEVHHLKLKGKQEPVEIYELIPGSLVTHPLAKEATP